MLFLLLIVSYRATKKMKHSSFHVLSLLSYRKPWCQRSDCSSNSPEFAIQYGCPVYQQWLSVAHCPSPDPLSRVIISLYSSHGQYCAPSTKRTVASLFSCCKTTRFCGVLANSANTYNKLIHPAFLTCNFNPINLNVALHH